jgi:hypothetical protein
VKMVSGLKSDEYSERLAELEMPTLEELRHQADMAMVHKLTNRRGGLDPAQWFEMAADGARSTRSAANPRNLRLRQGRLEIRRNFFCVRVVDSWNNIPDSVRAVAKSEQFQQKYKQMSRRDGETSTSKDDASRAHPGRGRFPRGSTWAIGDYTPSKQVSKYLSADLDPYLNVTDHS